MDESKQASKTCSSFIITVIIKLPFGGDSGSESDGESEINREGKGGGNEDKRRWDEDRQMAHYSSFMPHYPY